MATREHWRNLVGASWPAGSDFDVIEGPAPERILVIHQWPDRAAFHAWYASAEYAPWKEIRFASATANVVLIDGLPMEEGLLTNQQLPRNGSDSGRRDAQGSTPEDEIVALRERLAAVEAERDRMVFILDSIPNYAAYVDADLSYRVCNRKYATETGRSLDEFVGKHVVEFIGEQGLAKIQPYVERALIGGDEFVLLVEGLPDLAHVTSLADKIVESISNLQTPALKSIELGVSVGIAVYPNHGRDSRALLMRADEAMYEAKGRGKHRYCLWGEGH